MDKQIELAKSWYKLAEIIIILAGFMFAGSGIAYTNGVHTLSEGYDLLKMSQEVCSNPIASEINCNAMNNLTIKTFEMMTPQLELWKIMVIFGFGLASSSLIFCFIGYMSLRKLAKE